MSPPSALCKCTFWHSSLIQERDCATYLGVLWLIDVMNHHEQKTAVNNQVWVRDCVNGLVIHHAEDVQPHDLKSANPRARREP